MSDGSPRPSGSQLIDPQHPQPVASTSALTIEAAYAASTADGKSKQQQPTRQSTSTSTGANGHPKNTEAKTYSRSSNPQRPTVPTQTFADGTKGVPDRFELCEMNALIDLLANMLERVMRHNDQLPLVEANLTRFHSRAPPGISVTDYLRRIVQWTPVEPAALLILLLYIETISNKLPGFTINSLTVHRFLITGLMLAAKALSDSFMTNVRYAKVGGLTLVEINVLEREMLQALDYCLHSPGQLLAAFYRNLVEHHPGYSILKTDVQDRFSRSTAPDTASEGAGSAAAPPQTTDPSNTSTSTAASTNASAPPPETGSLQTSLSGEPLRNTSSGAESVGSDVSILKRKLSGSKSVEERAGRTGFGRAHSPPVASSEAAPSSKRTKTPLLGAMDRADLSRGFSSATAAAARTGGGANRTAAAVGALGGT